MKDKKQPFIQFVKRNRTTHKWGAILKYKRRKVRYTGYRIGHLIDEIRKDRHFKVLAEDILFEAINEYCDIFELSEDEKMTVITCNEYMNLLRSDFLQLDARLVKDLAEVKNIGLVLSS